MSVEPISPPLLQMSGITKRYPGVVANHNISLDVKAGEIHALLGRFFLRGLMAGALKG